MDAEIVGYPPFSSRLISCFVSHRFSKNFSKFHYINYFFSIFTNALSLPIVKKQLRHDYIAS